MYALKVFHPGEAVARQTHTATSADEVMRLIPKLLADHPGCERVEVHSATVKLFAVDCEGQRIPD